MSTPARRKPISNAIFHWSERLEEWMAGSALPLWLHRGFDPETGGAHEQLDGRGRADRDCARRVRVQARQMFVLANASLRGWIADGEWRVARVEQFVARYASHPSAPEGYVHTLDNRNRVADTRRDVYDIAFFLLACAWRFRAFGQTAALREAEALTRYLDTHIKGPWGGWLEGDYDAPVRRQNPHMHLFEAFIALYDATRNGRWLARAGEIFTLFESRFYDSRNGVLLEYFHRDWTPLSEDEGQEVEPGHMLEWVWLLYQYSRRSGAPVARYTRTLYDNALDTGQEKDTGLLFDAVTVAGQPLRRSKRCWPLTELVKASLCRAASGDPDAESRAARAIEALFEYYFSAEIPGLYIDRLDADNTVIGGMAPASTLYHLLLATAEVADYTASLKTGVEAVSG
ncbi:AGE family epimerase/isomerase [Microbulbifer halophilus]|uniref:AGE family epimerase/isomerase n=1 Tax=Microbulbifer halophilus TaxID=453963 RepID=A0ABW5E9R9_9GAMM|nr:AGE family epimerase/isomerase [Microbulbifer halophilus]MCW8126414.1 AGE family epimerase/isomerase [Microbulbifer halophilus]